MQKANKKLPKNIVDQWPEVFQDIELETIPIIYLHSVRVEFKDGKIWDIDIVKTKMKEDSHIKDIETSLAKLFSEYAEKITNIDFRLDVPALKRDIQKRTHTFMKRRR